MHLEGRLAPLPVPPETAASSSAAEEQFVAAGGGREGPLAHEAAAAWSQNVASCYQLLSFVTRCCQFKDHKFVPLTSAAVVLVVHIVDGDDVGLGDVGVARVEEVGDGGEHILEGDLKVDEATMINLWKLDLNRSMCICPAAPIFYCNDRYRSGRK